MSSRIQIVVDERERERFRRQARREGLSLSAWLRQAGRDRLAAREERRLLRTVADLRRFFQACDAREEGIEPSWEEHRRVISESVREGLPEP